MIASDVMRGNRLSLPGRTGHDLASIDPARRIGQVSYSCHSLTKVELPWKQKSQIAKITDEEFGLHTRDEASRLFLPRNLSTGNPRDSRAIFSNPPVRSCVRLWEFE